jgi:hypothetical protein
MANTLILDPLQLIDANGLALDVAANAALVANQRGLMAMAFDGTNTQYVRSNASGNLQDDPIDRAGRLVGVVYGSQGQQLLQTPVNFNLKMELAAGATLYDARQIRALTSADVVTAAQGTAAALAGKWPVQQTDGTNVMPTMDVAARAGFYKITDGTNTAVVKPASTPTSTGDVALAVAIVPGTPVPVVTPPRQRVSITYQAVATATADTLLSLVKSTNGSAAAAATTIPVAASKTLRITSMTFSLRAGAAVAAFATFTLRVNASGAALIGSPSEFRVDLGNTAAVIGAADKVTIPIPDGMEFSGTTQIAVSAAAQATTNILSVTLEGYEY